jgi:hypothetical protein
VFLIQIEGRVLKNTSISEGALGRVLDEVFANRGQILFVQALFAL